MSCEEMFILQRHANFFSQYYFPEGKQTLQFGTPQKRKKRHISALLILVYANGQVLPHGKHLWAVSLDPLITDQEAFPPSHWRGASMWSSLAYAPCGPGWPWYCDPRQLRELSPQWHQNIPAPSCCALPSAVETMESIAQPRSEILIFERYFETINVTCSF